MHAARLTALLSACLLSVPNVTHSVNITTGSVSTCLGEGTAEKLPGIKQVRSRAAHRGFDGHRSVRQSTVSWGFAL